MAINNDIKISGGITISTRKINEANLATNIQEIVTIISYILGNLELTQEQFQTGDVNQDGEINIVDVILFINNKIK